jgi:chitinase
VAFTPSPSSAQTQPPYRIVGYFPSWAIYDRKYFVTDIPADKLTHINYAFATVSPDGGVEMIDPWADTQFPYLDDPDDAPLKGNMRQLQLLKQAHPNLQTLISIGGWTESDRFSDAALTPESRAAFARSAADFMAHYGFDGVDIDWEYPTGGGEPGNIERAADPENFVLLLEALRAALDAQGGQNGRHYLLTIAAGAAPDAYEPLDWVRISAALDWINVMTYDMSGAWSEVTGFNAPLYYSSQSAPEGISTDSTLQAILEAGVPPEKLLMGVPFYGKGWSGVRAQNDGLHQPFTGVPAGTWEAGSFDYHDLVDRYIGVYQRHWSEAAQVPWLYDMLSGEMISYDDPESLTAKAQYVRDNGLGGIMFWELSQDTDDSALLGAIEAALNAQ